MDIKPGTYKALTPRERSVAYFEALARRDFTEADRLHDSCPRKTYTQPDLSFTSLTQGMTDAIVLHELELRGAALYLPFPAREEWHKSLVPILQMVAYREAAFSKVAREQSLDYATMKAAIRIRHPVVDLMLQLLGSEQFAHAINKDEAQVEKYAAEIRAQLKMADPVSCKIQDRKKILMEIGRG
jgi:hypothetical protein